MNSSLLTQLKASLPYAIVGAITAMAAILVAEIFVQAMKPPPAEAITDDSLAIAMLIDVSGSMEGEPIREVRRAAIQLLRNWDRPNTSFAIVPFSNQAYLLRPILTPAQDPKTLINQIQGLRAEGGTFMSSALHQAQIAFNDSSSSRHAVMLFTDGWAMDPLKTRRLASAIRQRGMVITAIGTQEADHTFLLRLTGGDPAKVFSTQIGSFAVAFDMAAQAIVTSSFGTASTAQGLAVVAVTALFLATAFLVAENVWSMRGNWWRDVWWISPVGLALGLLGGFVGESLFQGVIIAWAFVGLACGAALGLTDIVGGHSGTQGWLQRIPSKARRGALFGLAGGMVGGLIFSLLLGNANLATARGEWIALFSRLAGFGLLGFCVGLAIKAGEELLKGAWLLGTVKGPYEGKQYILSKPEVSVGKSGNNDINLHREVDVNGAVGRFLKERGAWFFQPEVGDHAPPAVFINGARGLQRTQLLDNTSIRFGNTEFLFRLRGDPSQLALETKWALASDTDVYAIPAVQKVTIGNGASCDVVIDDASMELQHCTLKFTRKGLQISPIAGAKVAVNDESLSSSKLTVLQQGDLIALGSMELALVEDRSERSDPET